MALGDITSTLSGESYVVELLASATAVNGIPTGAAGIDLNSLSALYRAPRSIRVNLLTTAGQGTMTVTGRLWLRAGGLWFVAKPLAAASTAPQTAIAITETGPNLIAYSEEVECINGAERLYMQIVAIAGDAAAKAELALDPLTGGNMDTVIEATTAGTAGNSLTIALVHSAGAANGGALTRVGNAFTFTFKGGTTTVANFETAVAALAGADDLIAVKTGGTGADILSATLDLLAATALAGGVDAHTVKAYAQVGR